MNSRRLLRRCRPDQIPFVAHFAHTQPFVHEISLCLRATTTYRIRTITHAAIKARRLRGDRYPLNIASRIRTISRTAIKARTTSIQEIVTCYHSLGRPACICSQILFLSLIEDMATISVCFNVYLVEQEMWNPKAGHDFFSQWRSTAGDGFCGCETLSRVIRTLRAETRTHMYREPRICAPFARISGNQCA